MTQKQVIGGPVVIDGRELSLSQAIRAGDFVFVTGQVPMHDGSPMTDGSIEDQTRACLDDLTPWEHRIKHELLENSNYT